jgi:hypothetical protein
MESSLTDSRLDDPFPPPPVKGSDILVPITTWADMQKKSVAESSFIRPIRLSIRKASPACCVLEISFVMSFKEKAIPS